jgi:TRAP-type C4-dicarboxylate transport system permease small subunit
MKHWIAMMDKAVNGVLFFLTLVLVFTTGAQISMRVLFDWPLSWTEEVARYVFIWWVFFGSIIALRERRHLGIDAVANLFPKKLLRFWETGIYLCILGYLAVMFFQGIKLVRVQMIHSTPITDIPLGWIIAIIPICAVLMTIYTIQLLWEVWRAKPQEASPAEADGLENKELHKLQEG